MIIVNFVMKISVFIFWNSEQIREIRLMEDSSKNPTNEVQEVF